MLSLPEYSAALSAASLPCPALPSLQGVMLEVFGAHNNARDFRNWKFARAISADELAQLQANRAKANPPACPPVRQMECMLHVVLHAACCMLHVAADGRHDRGGARPETSTPGRVRLSGNHRLRWAYTPTGPRLRCAALRGVLL